MAESTYNLTIKFSSASFVKDESICYVDIDDKQYELEHGDTLPGIPAESTVSLSLDAPLKSRHKLPYYTNSANDDIDEVEFDDYCAFTITKDTTVTLYATTYDTPYISFSEIEEESFTFTINDIDDKDRYLDYDIIDQDGKIIVSDYDINVRYDDSYSQTINNLNPNSIYIIYFSVYDANGSNEYGTYYTGGDEVSTKEAPKPTVSISEITATTAKVTLTSEGSYFVSAVIKVAPKGYTESKTVTLGSLGTSKTITITQLQPASDYTVYVL